MTPEDLKEHVAYARRSQRRVEQQIQIASVRLFDLDLAAGWRFFHVPNGGGRTKAEAAILKGMGVKPGVADVLFLSPLGLVYMLEFKAPGKTQRREQDEWENWCGSAGVPYRIAESVDDALRIATEWGALRGRVKVT